MLQLLLALVLAGELTSDILFYEMDYVYVVLYSNYNDLHSVITPDFLVCLEQLKISNG